MLTPGPLFLFEFIEYLECTDFHSLSLIMENSIFAKFVVHKHFIHFYHAYFFSKIQHCKSIKILFDCKFK